MAETHTCKAVRVAVGGQHVTVIDTPGFDDTKRSDAEILEEIAEFLCIQHGLSIPLKGIIYLHRITDNRMTGSAERYFEMFKRLCGEHNMENVVLATTMWSELKSEAIGFARERELRAGFWNVMEDKGSTVSRFDGSEAMAEAFICRLMRKKSIVLDIQDELVTQGKRLEETRAAEMVVPRLDQDIRDVCSKIEQSNAKLGDARRAGDEMEVRRLQCAREPLLEEKERKIRLRDRFKARLGKEALQKVGKKIKEKGAEALPLLVSLTNIVMTITVNFILPLAG